MIKVNGTQTIKKKKKKIEKDMAYILHFLQPDCE